MRALPLLAVMLTGCWLDSIPYVVTVDAGAPGCGVAQRESDAALGCYNPVESPAQVAAQILDPYPPPPLPDGLWLPAPFVEPGPSVFLEGGIILDVEVDQWIPGQPIATVVAAADTCRPRGDCATAVGLVEWTWLPAPELFELGFYPYIPTTVSACRILPRPICDDAGAVHDAMIRQAMIGAGFREVVGPGGTPGFIPDFERDEFCRTTVCQLRLGRALAAACRDANGWRFDTDGDGAGDGCDNCRMQANAAQADADGDGFGDVCDVCPADGSGLASQDGDGDGQPDCRDNCPGRPNDQADRDGDGIGDACDNCRDDANPGQRNSDDDPFGDACDRCPEVTDNQLDTDGDGVGDACDNCPEDDNPDQSDADELTPWAADFPGGDACDPPGRPMAIDTSPLRPGERAKAAEAVARYVITLGGEEWPWAQIVAEAAASFDAPAPGEPVAMAARAPLDRESVAVLPDEDPLEPDRREDRANRRLGFRIGRHFEDLMKRTRCSDFVDPDTGVVLQRGRREVRYYRPTRNQDDPNEVLLDARNRPRFRRADCFYEKLGGLAPDGSVLSYSLPGRIEEYKASRSRRPEFSRSYRRRIRQQAEDLKWFVATTLREEFFPDRAFRDLWQRMHHEDYWPWRKPPLAIYRCVPGLDNESDCAPALQEAFAGPLFPMRAARQMGAGTAFQWTVDNGLGPTPPEWMPGCRTPPREWHELDDEGRTVVFRHCDWSPWAALGERELFDGQHWAPTADGMYVDADWFNPDTRAINRGLIAAGAQDEIARAVVLLSPWGIPVGRALLHNDLEPRQPEQGPVSPVLRTEQGWWLLVSRDDLVLMHGIPDFEIDGDEAYDLAIE